MTDVMVSSKGQIVLPKEIRERYGWKKGTTVVVEDVFNGIMIFEVPDKPLLHLRGMLKNSGGAVAELLQDRRREALREKKEAEKYWRKNEKTFF